MLAKDIMRPHVLTLTPGMTLREAARLFSLKHITGAPVLGPTGQVVGVVSQTDLVRRERDSSPQETPLYHRDHEEWLVGDGASGEDADVTCVAQVMTPWAISFEEDTPVAELAQQMLSKRIHRVLITRQGDLCGIVTSMDMLKALCGKRRDSGGAPSPS